MTHYSHVLLNLSYDAVRGRERKILTLSRSSSALPSWSLKVPNDEKRLGWPKLIQKITQLQNYRLLWLVAESNIKVNKYKYKDMGARRYGMSLRVFNSKAHGWAQRMRNARFWFVIGSSLI